MLHSNFAADEKFSETTNIISLKSLIFSFRKFFTKGCFHIYLTFGDGRTMEVIATCLPIEKEVDELS